MSDKQLKKALIIVVAIIVLLVVFFGIRAFLINKKAKEPFAYEIEKRERIKDIQDGKITGKYSSNVLSDEYIFLEQEDRKYVDHIIDMFLDMVNDYSLTGYLWQCYLTEEYKQSMFSSNPDNYYDYLDKNFPSKKYYCKNYEIDDDVLIMYVLSTEDNNESMKVLKVVDYKDIFCKLYFGNLKSIKNVRMTANSDDIYITCSSIMHYGDYSALLLNIENLTDEELTVDFGGSYIMKEEGRDYQNYILYDKGDKPIVSIPAKKTIQYELKFTKFTAYAEKVRLMMEFNGEKLDIEDAFITTNRTITD